MPRPTSQPRDYAEGEPDPTDTAADLAQLARMRRTVALIGGLFAFGFLALAATALVLSVV